MRKTHSDKQGKRRTKKETIKNRMWLDLPTNNSVGDQAGEKPKLNICICSKKGEAL